LKARDGFRQPHRQGSRLGALFALFGEYLFGGLGDELFIAQLGIEAGDFVLGLFEILLEAGALVGIVTDGDIRRHLDGIASRKAADVMTRNPKIAHPGQLAAEALALMTENKITQLFVLEEGSAAPLGVLHIHDCLRAGIA